jgi:hypothetical protein
MNSRRNKLLKSRALRQAMRFIATGIVIALIAIFLLAITDVERTHALASQEAHKGNHSLTRLAPVSGEAKSTGNLGGQMPHSFDKDVARVMAASKRRRR